MEFVLPIKYGPVMMGNFTKILQQISMDRPWGPAGGYLDGSMQNCSNSSALAVLRSAIDLFVFKNLSVLYTISYYI